MSNFYAQIDAINVVVGISDLGGVFNDSKYVIIDDYDLDLLGKLYTGTGIPGTPFDEDEFEDYYPPLEDGDGDGTGTGSGSSSGCGLTFPQFTLEDKKLVSKTHHKDYKDSTKKELWDALVDREDDFWNSGYTTVSDNSTTQTILDFTGKGILTNIISPDPGANDSIINITIIKDGFSLVFESPEIREKDRYVLGFLLPATDEHGHHHSKHGDAWSDTERALMTPEEVVYQYKSGLKFETSLKIEIQCDNGFHTSSYKNRAGFTYLTYLPQGY